MRRQHRTCRGCREARAGETVREIGHVCAECMTVLGELADIVVWELERELEELREANRQVAAVVAVLKECA